MLRIVGGEERMAKMIKMGEELRSALKNEEKSGPVREHEKDQKKKEEIDQYRALEKMFSRFANSFMDYQVKEENIVERTLEFWTNDDV